MAQPLAPGELGSWRGENVRLSQVIDALGELRRGGQRTATRASVTNLVLVAADDDEVERACNAVHRLGRRHPGRNIVVLPRPGARPDGVDASVLLHGSVAEGRPVWSEDIRLQVRGAPAEHLASLVEPLTLPDLPVAVWFVRGVPEPGDALVRAADSVVVDLCWARLLPLRQLLAAQFDAPAVAPYARRVHRAEVGGPPAARLLLAGWLVARPPRPGAPAGRRAPRRGRRTGRPA
ncbi:MAG TPA: glucose-6-phosphate dehydrogenase assembly protein OpcA, partial [Acidimicrobiales bacterium]|nr:glucose-6-phosphate dehydrogenase assembly protein OpcA [Acidimicrobiales bacterium]